MRECGGCTECCTAIGVVELNKPPGVRCQHLTEQGCGIYEDRPPSCRSYFCLWADEKAAALDLPDWGRPDRTGVLLNALGHDMNKAPALKAFIRPGTEENPNREYWAQKLLKRTRLQAFKIVRG